MRCVQTVEPLAAACRLRVEDGAELIEGAPLSDTLRLIHELAGIAAALCTHGDVMHNVCEQLVAERVIRRSDVRYEKGGFWLLEQRNARITRASYVPPQET